jgi:hypothetical protein
MPVVMVDRGRMAGFRARIRLLKPPARRHQNPASTGPPAIRSARCPTASAKKWERRQLHGLQCPTGETRMLADL